MKRFLARPRHALALGSLTVVALGAMFVMFGQYAYATHAEIEASVDCEGVVHYTATAWNGETEQQRTNENIGIWYRTSADGTWVQLPHESTHMFDAANGFSFSDSFTLPAPLPAWVQLKTQAQANWGNGWAPGETKETGEITVPEGCTPDTQQIPTTTTTVPETTTTTTVAESTTTTTVAGTTTSSAPPTTAPPTTAPPTTAPPTTAPPTTQVLGVQGTVAPAATPPAATPLAVETLPQTGGGDSALVLFGLIAAGAGIALLAGVRLRSHS